MILAALNWPDAVVAAVSVFTLGLVISVVTWQIFRTGQTAIRKEIGQHELLKSMRAEIAELNTKLDVSNPPADTEGGALPGAK